MALGKGEHAHALPDELRGSHMNEGLAGGSNASPDDIATYYDTWASSGDYDDDVAGWGYEAPERAAAMAAEHLKLQPGPVLDAGCGTGRAGNALRAIGIGDLVGGDFNGASVDAARSRGVYRSVDHLDLNDQLNFDDGQFAVVVSVGVFSYLVDTAATVRELLRITKQGGAIIFTQRTDLWDERGCDALISLLVAEGACSATTSDHQPYLPLHPEFGAEIGIIYTTLVVQ
jgi:SAM-dependent methyltransferase